jgi:hypothetical protein
MVIYEAYPVSVLLLEYGCVGGSTFHHFVLVLGGYPGVVLHRILLFSVSVQSVRCALGIARPAIPSHRWWRRLLGETLGQP